MFFFESNGGESIYYQILVETNEKIGKLKENKKIYELDRTDKKEILDDIIIPYLKKEEITVNGYFLNYSEITRIIIETSTISSKEFIKILNSNDEIFGVMPNCIINSDHTNDITKTIFKEAKEFINKNSKAVGDKKVEEGKISNKQKNNNKVFIVHGHDDVLKLEVARVIEKLKLKAIILHEQINGGGSTIIEKLEEHTDVGYGIVLYTPCDVGGKSEKDLKTRARQNVVFEHGLLIGKLGRNRVMTIKKDDVELPGDISGTVYTSANEGWKNSLIGELKKLGYEVNANDLY